MTSKKTAPAKKTAAKKAAAKVPDDKVLYTIRLEPSIIAKLNAKAAKQGTTHAAVAREILHAGI